MITWSTAVVAWGAVVAETPAPQPETPDANSISPGVLGFVSFLFLVAAVVLLYRSMNKQIKKVSPTLPDGPADRMREEDVAIIAEAERRGAAQARHRAATQRSAGGRQAPGAAAAGPDRPAAGDPDATGGSRPAG